VLIGTRGIAATGRSDNVSSKRKRANARRKAFPVSRALLIVGVIALLAVAGIGAVMAFDGGDGGPRTTRQTPVVTDATDVTVDVIDNDYEPRDLTVPLGARVTWTFSGNLPHTVTNEEGKFDSGIFEDGDEYHLTFESPGTYTYYCTLHHAMRGTVIVSD
jgi:plastocyanin